jgi:hypothetical protein
MWQFLKNLGIKERNRWKRTFRKFAEEFPIALLLRKNLGRLFIAIAEASGAM